MWAPDFPWGRTEEQYRRELERSLRIYGSREEALEVARDFGPHENDETVKSFLDYLRYGASPGMVEALYRMNKEVDIRHVLPAVRVPTLVMHGDSPTSSTRPRGRSSSATEPGVICSSVIMPSSVKSSSASAGARSTPLAMDSSPRSTARLRRSAAHARSSRTSTTSESPSGQGCTRASANSRTASSQESRCMQARASRACGSRRASTSLAHVDVTGRRQVVARDEPCEKRTCARVGDQRPRGPGEEHRVEADALVGCGEDVAAVLAP
jgi:hypothetical protein